MSRSVSSPRKFTWRNRRRAVGLHVGVGLAAIALSTVPASASEVVIDQASGAVFTGLVDGFPGLFPLDGVPDAPDKLGAALKAGVTEERGVGEYPLLPLRAMCLTPDDVVAATLSFNIDDVLSTFGPGTEFNGEAGDEFLIHPFSGNGTVGMSDGADFQRTAALPYVVDTTLYGVITDGTLAASGPLPFAIDVTAALTGALGGSQSHLGFLWRTTDSPTGTSLDNLGNQGQGPPGVNGARMPFLTVTTAPLHLNDLRCAARDTACLWGSEPGDVAYDVIRGNLSQLSESAALVDLGVVTCIENDSTDTSTVGHSDSATPLAGQGFFYLMRPVTVNGQGGYGSSTRCRERLALSGDCN